MTEKTPDWHVRDVLQLTRELPAEPKKERAVKKPDTEKAVKE